jgi:hypothetical protein
MPSPQRSIPAALTLFFIAPLVAEYLLGDFPITFLAPLILLTPLYGGGALLIREVARRTGRGWPTILLLGVAYALIEEGYTTQTLFNPDFLNLHLNLLRFAWIPSLGIGGWWTLFMLNVHPFFSIGVSIALVEGLFPSRARTPWLGNAALSVVAVLYTAAVYVFIATAFLIPRPAKQPESGQVPSPWLTGAAAFLLGAAVFFAPLQFNWGAVAWILAVDFTFLSLLWVFSRRSAWTPLHTFSIGAGGALLYGVHAFMGNPVVASPRWVVRSSNALFLALAVVLVVVAAHRTRAALRGNSAPATLTS